MLESHVLESYVPESQSPRHNLTLSQSLKGFICGEKHSLLIKHGRGIRWPHVGGQSELYSGFCREQHKKEICGN